jgi:hypothetical protein
MTGSEICPKKQASFASVSSPLNAAGNPLSRPVLLSWQMHAAVPTVLCRRQKPHTTAAGSSSRSRAEGGEGDREHTEGNRCCCPPAATWWGLPAVLSPSFPFLVCRSEPTRRPSCRPLHRRCVVQHSSRHLCILCAGVVCVWAAQSRASACHATRQKGRETDKEKGRGGRSEQQGNRWR